MARIFVNGVSAKTGGGISILSNFLSCAATQACGDEYFVLTPNAEQYAAYASDRIHIVDVNSLFKQSLLFPILQEFVLPRLIDKLHCDRVLNFGDIPIPTRIRQCFLFDWAYAIYPDNPVWARMELREWLVRRIKLAYFRRFVRYPAVFAAQTRTAKALLAKQYGLKDIVVIPNAVALEHLSEGEPREFSLPRDRVKLLCLSHYYVHKNIEIFLPLAKEIRERQLPYAIVTTIRAEQSPGAQRFLDRVKADGLADIIVNLGPVSMKHVPSLYAQCDGLLLPTLLESFSGTYVEAMFQRTPILTSDLDFARDVCGDVAYYFDPLREDSILEAIEEMLGQPDLCAQRRSRGLDRVRAQPTWADVFRQLRGAVQ